MDFDDAEVLNQAIRTVAIRHRALAAAKLAPLGLHPGQEIVLLELAASGPRTQAQLAVSSGCEAPTITHTARKLEAAGLILRRPSPTDGRATVVELSERGRALLPALRRAWCALAEDTVAALATTTDPAELTTALTDLAAGLSTRQCGGPPC
ncbi:MAG: MarR family winged helix-turn-helix transcriptional regulator [Pseudonocardia sp.]